MRAVKHTKHIMNKHTATKQTNHNSLNSNCCVSSSRNLSCWPSFCRPSSYRLSLRPFLRPRKIAGVVCLTAILFGANVSVFASTNISAQSTIQETEEQIRDAESRLSGYETQRERFTDGIAYLSAEEYAVINGLEEASQEYDELKSRVIAARQSLNASITRYNTLVEQINELMSQQAELDELTKKLAVQRYVQARAEPAEIIFSTPEVSEGLSITALTEVLFGNVSKAVEESRRIADDLNIALAEAQSVLQEREDHAAELNELEPALEDKKEIWEDLSSDFESLKGRWESRLAQLNREEAELKAFINQKRQNLEVLRKLQEAALTGSAGFVRPALGAMGSGYGMRVHPILGYARLHAGIDFDGRTGDPVFASQSGVVISAGNLGGYGRTIIIQHRDGFTTLYAHLSRHLVSVGDVVNTGQRIGLIGSTGLSTGPHLHFEIRRNGNAVNPATYLR